MKWARDAEQAVSKVPFFIRNKVKKKVEAHVREAGAGRVTLKDVTALKKQFLSRGGMDRQVKGYTVSACFGADGCPHAVTASADLLARLEDRLETADLRSFLKERVSGGLKFHHEFRVVLADCPNACSRPQIADMGIIGAVKPALDPGACTGCGLCKEACAENAVSTDPESALPVIDSDSCLYCGACIRACPEKALGDAETGYRVLLGGRLGRHPRLGMEVPGIHSQDEVLEMAEQCLAFYKTHATTGQRFSHLIKSTDQVV